MKQALFIAMFLLATGAMLADTHYVAVNGSCANHSSPLGDSFVSCADSITAGCTEAKPCCEINDGYNAASDGDTIEIHHGTYQDGVNYTDSSGNYGWIGSTWSLRIATDNLSFTTGSGDTATMDLQNSVNGAIVVESDGVTITATISAINPKVETGGNRYGLFQTWSAGAVSDLTVSNFSADIPTAGHAGSISTNFCFNIMSADNVDLNGNTCTGGWDFALRWIDGKGTTGGLFRNNTVTGNGRGGGAEAQRGFLLQGNHSSSSAILAVYNNTLIQDAINTSMGIYARENTWKLRMFNNIFNGVGTCLYLQDEPCRDSCDWPDEDSYFFNTTCIANANEDLKGVHSQNYTLINVVNVVFDSYDYGIDTDNTDAAEDSGSCTGVDDCSDNGHSDTLRTNANSDFHYNNVYDYTAVSDPDPTTGIDVSNTVTGDPNPDGSGKLQAGSAAIGAGTNNPLGQGADTCSFTVGSVTVDCSIDIDGDNRGSSWDIGADEFSGDETPPRRILITN